MDLFIRWPRPGKKAYNGAVVDLQQQKARAVNRTQLKQRIVGAIVLVALGVIFIPMVLQRDDAVNISDSNIPEIPKELKKIAKRELPEITAPPAPPEATRQPVDEHTPDSKAQTDNKVPPPEQKAAPETKSTPDTKQQAKQPTRAWVVQVASFSERKKALALRDRLRKAGYTAFVESLSTKNSVLYRVRVGPVVKRSEAEELQKKIISKFRLKDALVMAHP